VKTVREAMTLILPPREGKSSQDRWKVETPYLGKLISEKLNILGGTSVLDLGCGMGRLAKELRDTRGCNIIGVDQSFEMRVLAENYVGPQKFFTMRPEGLDTFAVAGHKLNFSAAIMTWSLQCMENPEREILRLKRLLRQNGVLFAAGEKKRRVPTKDGVWEDDGLDVRKLLSNHLKVEEEGTLDPGVVGARSAKDTFWGVYRLQ
jgi:SAM-dependent methyltransferase